VKTALVQALNRTFDAEYPTADFRDILVSLEFPVAKESYPSIWVDFTPVGQYEIAGIDHKEREFIDTTVWRDYTRWTFNGTASFTVVALTNLEMSRLHDEVARILAFGLENPRTSEFRTYIEDNKYVAMEFDWDQVEPSGFASTQGTPWGTDEIIWEGTLSMEATGEFVSEGVTGGLVDLTAIEVVAYATDEPDPTLADPDVGVWR
jgi:hypothetical protein